MSGIVYCNLWPYEIGIGTALYPKQLSRRALWCLKDIPMSEYLHIVLHHPSTHLTATIALAPFPQKWKLPTNPLDPLRVSAVLLQWEALSGLIVCLKCTLWDFSGASFHRHGCNHFLKTIFNHVYHRWHKCAFDYPTSKTVCSAFSGARGCLSVWETLQMISPELLTRSP